MLRILIADDERPARRFLANLLAGCADVELVGEAANGREAVELIERLRPDLALLDLQMPELGGLDAARLVAADALPAIVFVTAFDEFAVEAFELNAVDYLLKPVEQDRLQAAVDRARIRVRAAAAERARTVSAAASALEPATRRTFLERIPVRRRDEVVLLPVRQIASIVAEGELLHLTTIANERYTIRLPPARARGAAGSAAVRPPRPRHAGGARSHPALQPDARRHLQVTLSNGQQLPASRIQSKVLRETLLRL